MPPSTGPGSSASISQQGGASDGIADVNGIDLASDALASGEWVQRPDPLTGRPYYIQTSTGLAVWDLSSELLKRQRQLANPIVREAIASGEWSTALDDATRSLYYYHPLTSHTAWELTEGDVLQARAVMPPGNDPSPSDQPTGEEVPPQRSSTDGGGGSNASNAGPGTPSGDPPPQATEEGSRGGSEGGGGEEGEGEGGLHIAGAPEDPPVFPENQPGSRRAQEMLDMGYWVWGRDSAGFLFFTEVATLRTVRDLRAEMAQATAEERNTALLREEGASELPPSPPRGAEGEGSGASAAADNETPAAPATPPGAPPGEGGGGGGGGAGDDAFPEMPQNDPMWEDPETPSGSAAESLLEMPQDDPDAHSVVGPAEFPKPDFEAMFAGGGGGGAEEGPYGTDTALREMAVELQGISEGFERQPVIRPVPRRKRGADARGRWGAVSYLNDENREVVAAAVRSTAIRRDVESSLEAMQKQYAEAVQGIVPVALPKLQQQQQQQQRPHPPVEQIGSPQSPAATPRGWIDAPVSLSGLPSRLRAGSDPPFSPDAKVALRLRDAPEGADGAGFQVISQETPLRHFAV